MLMSPEGIAEELNDLSYEELIKYRNDLIKEIRHFERGNIDELEYEINPSPEVYYSMNLLYLARVLEIMHYKFIERNIKKISGKE